MIGEIISGGLSLLGGLFGSKKPKKEKTETVTTTSALPGALASVGGMLGQAFERKIDPLEAKKRQLDTALVDYQLRQLKDAPAGALYPGSTYTGTKLSRRLVSDLGPSAGTVASAPATRRPVQGPNKPGEGVIVGGDNPTVSSMGWNNGRYGLFHAPYMPDGDTVEQIYGDVEPVTWPYGIAKVVNDIGYTAYRNGAAAWQDFGAPASRQIKKAIKRNPFGGQTPAEHKALLRGLPRPPGVTW
jgi:hypothetical protein